MVSRAIWVVNVVLACLVVAALVNLSFGDLERVDIRRRLARGGSRSSSRSSSSRSSSRSRSSSSSSTSRTAGTTPTRTSGGNTANSYYRSSYTPTSTTYTPTRTYRSATTYTYDGRNAQTIDNTATYKDSPTQYTTLYRSTTSADYYKTGGISSATWFGYQSYYYGSYYRNCYYCYRHNEYRYDINSPAPQRQLFSFVETSCALHGCVALNDTGACFNATQNMANTMYKSENQTLVNVTGTTDETKFPTYCVTKMANTTSGQYNVTEYTQATEDQCSPDYPCLCSCMVTLTDTAGVGSVSILLAGMLMAFVMF